MEEKKIKLTNEQILEKEIQLAKTKMNLEMAELNVRQFTKALEEELPMKQAKVELNNMNKQIEMLKHNVVALTGQIETGVM